MGHTRASHKRNRARRAEGPEGNSFARMRVETRPMARRFRNLRFCPRARGCSGAIPVPAYYQRHLPRAGWDPGAVCGPDHPLEVRHGTVLACGPSCGRGSESSEGICRSREDGGPWRAGQGQGCPSPELCWVPTS